MKKSFQYRIFPSHKQIKILNQQLYLSKEIWNHLLNLKIETYKNNKQSLSKFDLNKYLTIYKEQHPESKLVHSQVLQNISEKIHLSFQSFFRRIKNHENPGFPRFKSIDRMNSMSFPQSGYKLLLNHNQKENRISISKVGHIKLKYHREIEGDVKRMTIKKSRTDKWYVIFSCDGNFLKPLPKTGKTVGIDMGVSTFATFSDKNTIKNPRFFKQEKKALSKVQRQFDKVKDKHKTKIRRVKKHAVARVYERIQFKRDNFAWHEANKIVKEYDIICFENLNIKKMLESEPKDNTPLEKCKKRNLNRSIQDVAWGESLSKLSFKAEEAGKITIAVDPRNTSKTCFQCGNIQEMPLEKRQFVCEKCSWNVPRDFNSALVIERLGLQSLDALKRVS